METRASRPVNRLRKLGQGLEVQFSVISALILREANTRYGRDNVGYLWIILEPMILATVISLIHMNASTHFGSDIAPVPYAIVGYTIFIIFRGIFNRAEGSIEANQHLLHHRNITIIDITVARAFLDVAGCFMTMCLLLGLACALGYADLPERPHHLLIAVVLMSWWSLSLAMIAIGLTYGNETYGRLMHPISYFSIPISGAFVSLDWMPEGLRNVLEWFPMALIFEEARYGQFRSAPDTYVDIPYVIVTCAFLNYWGLLLCRRLRRRVEVR